MGTSNRSEGTSHKAIKVALLFFLVPVFLIIALQVWETLLHLLRDIAGIETRWVISPIALCGLVSSLWFTFWMGRKIWRYEP